jgi:hypothetical protein
MAPHAHGVEGIMSKAFVADLINDQLDIHDKGTIAQGFSFGTEPPGKLDAEITERRAQLDQIEKDFATDPEYVVRHFRNFYKNEHLTTDDIRGWIDTWKFAFDHPDDFKREITAGQPSFGVGDWFNRLRAYLHVPPDTSSTDQKTVDELVKRYGIDDDIAKQIKPNNRQFETLDPGWIQFALAKYREASGKWPEGLEKFRRHESSATSYVYEGKATYDDKVTSKVALLSDFGTGLYHSAAIAKQLFKARYPYVFHCGDVYYGGKQSEFDERFTPQLAAVVNNSQFYGLAENHELYSKGTAYLKYLDTLRGQGSTQQEGSYFCVRFAKHQIIGLDVNWNGRQAFEDQKTRDWLAKVISDGGSRTNILLSGSAPYYYGEAGRKPLLGHLWQFVKDGAIQAWFWGDDHYCALFPRDKQLAPFIGSCIGHGGYPSDTTSLGKPSWATPIWVETASRFPKWTKLRQDRGNNGWVEMNLCDHGGIELTYVDWLGAKRFFASFARDNERLIPIGPRELPNREDGMPELHKP